MQLSLGICLGLVLGLLQIPEFEDAHDPYIKVVWYLHMTYTHPSTYYTYFQSCLDCL